MMVAFEKGEALRHIGHLDLMRTMQRALRRNFAPMHVSLIVRSPQLAEEFLSNPMKYAAFILNLIKSNVFFRI